MNDAAIAYKGKIPSDRWKQPYMSAQELKEEIQSGVQFYGLKDNNVLVAVMGIQPVNDVTLIRHAYVLTKLPAERTWRKTTQTFTRFSRNLHGLRWNMGSSDLGNKILSKKWIQTGFNRRKE